MYCVVPGRILLTTNMTPYWHDGCRLCLLLAFWFAGILTRRRVSYIWFAQTPYTTCEGNSTTQVLLQNPIKNSALGFVLGSETVHVAKVVKYPVQVNSTSMMMCVWLTWLADDAMIMKRVNDVSLRTSSSEKKCLEMRAFYYTYATTSNNSRYQVPGTSTSTCWYL